MENSSVEGVSKGAYVIGKEENHLDAIIIVQMELHVWLHKVYLHAFNDFWVNLYKGLVAPQARFLQVPPIFQPLWLAFEKK